MRDLAIVLYTSTKGHFGCKTVYKKTVERLQEQLRESYDSFDKIAHIKWKKGEEETLEEIKKTLKEEGFKVLSTEGKWNHNTSSHAKEYYKDMLKVFSDITVRKNRLTLFCEDDWLLNFDKVPINRLDNARAFLDTEKDILCVRINNEIEKDLSKALKTKSTLIYKQGRDYTPYGPTFTFQPTIVRTLEWYHALRIINKNLDILDRVHCEILSGEVFKQFSDSETPFCFFDPSVVSAEHIGEKEKIKKYNLK